MLEIKPYSEWSQATTAPAEPIDKVRQYADYLRTNYYKAGELNDTTESEIADGIRQRAQMDGLVTDDQPEEERQAVYDSLLRPKQDTDTDARFLLDHYRYSDDTPEASEKAATIQQYLTLKKIAPERVGEIQDIVNGYTADKDAVKRARMSAVDRGDYQVVAVDEEDGRQLYTGSNASPDTVNSNIESLVRSGAIAPADLKDVKKLMDPLNGGRTTVAENNRFAIFADTISSLIKRDPQLSDLIDDQARLEREQKTQALRSTGEKAWEGVKTVVGGTISGVADALLNPFLPEQDNPSVSRYGTVGNYLANNEALNKTFSPAEIEKFSNALVTRSAGPAYRADKPETGIETDTLGNVVLSPAIIPNKAQFESALAASQLSDDQKETASARRVQMLENQAPKLLSLILSESEAAVAAYAQAKRDGKPVPQFIEEWVGNNAQNYDGMSERLQQLGMSTVSALATLPVGIAALAGYEPAAQALVSLNKDQSDREEYARLFGDEFGLGFQIVNTIPQVATDILATMGTSGAYAGAKTLLKGGTRSLIKGAEKTILREAAMGAVSALDTATAATVREAAAAGGEALTSKALKEVSTGLAARLSPTEELIPVFATSSLRSSSSAYGSIYSQLPEDMSHEDKHKAAFGYAIAAGIATGVITTGMSLFNRGGLEDLATGKIRPLTAAEEGSDIAGKIPLDKLNYKQTKLLFESVRNEGQFLKDAKFQEAMRANLSGSIKNYLRTTLHGGLDEGLEESIDQAVQIKLEDAALDRKTPLADKISQIFSAGLIGGILGGTTPAISQLAKPLTFSEQTEALSGRATLLANVASTLRKSGSNATAEILERRMAEAKVAADASRQKDIAAQTTKETLKKTELEVDPDEKHLTLTGGEAPVKPQEELDMVKPVTFLSDLEGEKVFAHNMYGTISIDEDGQARLNFLKPTASGNTSLTLGSRFRNAEGLVSRYPEVMVTAKAIGDESTGNRIPAGTPYIIRDKNKYALPYAPAKGQADASFVPHVDEDGKVIRLDVLNAQSLSDPNIKMDLHITSPYQIKAIAAHYNIDLGKYRAAPASAEIEDVVDEEESKQDLGKVAETVQNPVSKEALLRAHILNSADPETYDIVQSVMKGRVTSKAFANRMSQLTTMELSKVRNTAAALNNFAVNDSDSPAEVRRLVGQYAGELQARAEQATQIQISNLEKAAVANTSAANKPAEAAPAAPAEAAPAEAAPAAPAEAAPAAPAEETPKASKTKRATRPTVVVATAPQPAEATSAAKSETVTPEGNTIVENVSLADKIAELRATRGNLANEPIIDTDHGKVSFTEAQKILANLEGFLEDAKANNSEDGIINFSARIEQLKADLKKASRALKARETRLTAKIVEAMTPIEGGELDPLADEIAQERAYILEQISILKPVKAPTPPKEPKEPKASKPKRAPLVGEDWSTPENRHKFRNEQEERVFNELVEQGVITNLNIYGSIVSGIDEDSTFVAGEESFPVFTLRRYDGDIATANLYIKGKHILLRESVYAKYPKVEYTKTEGNTEKSRKAYSDPDTGLSRQIDIPVIRDANGDATTGIFTNDYNITLAQINHPLQVFIPEALIKRHNDTSDKFQINKSIKFNEANGRVEEVYDAKSCEWVLYSGEGTISATGIYTPARSKPVLALLENVIFPSGSVLKDAGVTAKGRQSFAGRGITVADYLNDLHIYLDGGKGGEGIGEGIGKGVGEAILRGNWYTGKGYGLNQISVDEAKSFIYNEYAKNLFEFSIARKISQAALQSLTRSQTGGLSNQLKAISEETGLTIAQLKGRPDLLTARAAAKNVTDEQLKEDQSALETIAQQEGLTVEDLLGYPELLRDLGNLTPESLNSLSGLTKLVTESFKDSDPAHVAKVIVEVDSSLKGGSPDAIISKYAKKLFARISQPEGDFYLGLPSASSLVNYYGKLFQMDEGRRGARNTTTGWTIGEENISKLDALIHNGRINDDALDPLFNVTRDDGSFDSAETASAYSIGLRKALVDSVNQSPELAAALRSIAGAFDPNLATLSGELLVDSLSNVIANNTSSSDIMVRKRAHLIVNQLYAGDRTSGLKAAGIMVELGWLPPVLRYSAVPPMDTTGYVDKAAKASVSELKNLIKEAKDATYRKKLKLLPEAEANYRNMLTEGVLLVGDEIRALNAKATRIERDAILQKRYSQDNSELISRFEQEDLTKDKVIAAISNKLAVATTRLDEVKASITTMESGRELHDQITNLRDKLVALQEAGDTVENAESITSYSNALDILFKQSSDNSIRAKLNDTALEINTKLVEKYTQQLNQFTELDTQKIISILKGTGSRAQYKAAIFAGAAEMLRRDALTIAITKQSTESHANLLERLESRAADLESRGNIEEAKRVRQRGAVTTNRTTANRVVDYDRVANFLKRHAEKNGQQYKSRRVLRSDVADAARSANTERMGLLGIQSGDPQSVIDALKIISKGKSAQHRAVANLLLSAPEFLASVNFVTVDLESDWAGLYDNMSNTVLVNLAASNGRGLDDVLLHEYLHAATVGFLNNPVTPAQKAAVARITQIRNLATARAEALGLTSDSGISYGLSGNEEFLTAALTMPEFQSVLNSLAPAGQRSILRRIVDAIMSMFGSSKPEAIDAVRELLDFTKMSLANRHTFSINGDRDIRSNAAIQEHGKEDMYHDIVTSDLIDRIMSGARDEVFMSQATEPENIDPVEVIKTMIPADYAVDFDDNHNTAVSAAKGIVKINQEMLKESVSGLAPHGVRAVIRSTVDVALAKAAASDVFTTEDLAAIAEAAGPDILNAMAHTLYASKYPDAAERKLRIAEDRLSGDLTDVALAQEMVLGEIHQLAFGNARADRLDKLSSEPKVMERFLQALRVFINHLKDRFAVAPTTSTAAKISLASREFRRLRNGGVLPKPEEALRGELGDSGAFLNAIDNTEVEGQEDRTKFDLVIASSKNPDIVTNFWNTVGNKLKLTNMPMQLKEILDARDGTLSEIQFTMERFFSAFPKLRDAALNGGADIETISKVLGTTAPMVNDEARKAIAKALREYRKSIKGDTLIDEKVANQERALYEIEANRYAADFRIEQQAAEESLRNMGFGKLVDTMVEVREEMNRYKVKIGFHETNDVYLTRTYRYFNTPAWMSAVKSGLVHTDEKGNTVDFGKLRHTAAMAMYADLVQDNAKEGGIQLTNEALEEAVLKLLDEKLLELDERAKESKTLGGITSLRRDLNLLKTKKDIDAPLRELLGEVKDPLENAVRTLYNVGRLAANNTFLNDFQRNVIALKLGSTVETEGMELLFNEKKDPELGKLSGLYVRSDIAAALREQFGPKGRDMKAGATGAIENIGRGLSYFGGLTIFAKTSLSVGYWPRNVIGGIALSAAQGIPPLTPSSMKALRLAWQANLNEGRLNKTERTDRDLIRRLTELQIFRDETRGRIASDMMKGFVSGTDEQLDDAMKTVLDAQLTGDISKLAKLGIKFDKFQDTAGQLNNLVDSMFKAHAFFYELNNLKESYGDSLPIEQLEAKAARKVKLTFPTHSQQLDITKAYNRSPYAMIAVPFLRWKTEVLRTMVNTPILAYQELTSGNAGEVKRGAQRLIGYGVTTGAGSAIAAKAFASLFAMIGGAGDDDKDRDLTAEELSKLRIGLPNWQRNHSLSARIVGGKMQIIDITNILPYSQFTDIGGIMAEGMRTGKGINPKELASYFSGELLGSTIAFNTVKQVADNRDDFGKPIALDSDDAATASLKLLKHLASGTVAPSAVLKGMQAFRAGEKDTQNILIGELTGARPNIHEFNEVIRRGMFSLKDSQEQAVSILAPIRSGRKLDVNDVPDILEDHQIAMNKVQGKLSGLINTMKSIGATNADIFAAAKASGFSQETIASGFKQYRITWRPNGEFFSKMKNSIDALGEDDFQPRAKAILDVKANEPDKYMVNP